MALGRAILRDMYDNNRRMDVFENNSLLVYVANIVIIEELKSSQNICIYNVY